MQDQANIKEVTEVNPNILATFPHSIWYREIHSTFGMGPIESIRGPGLSPATRHMF